MVGNIDNRNSKVGRDQIIGDVIKIINSFEKNTKDDFILGLNALQVELKKEIHEKLIQGEDAIEANSNIEKAVFQA